MTGRTHSIISKGRRGRTGWSKCKDCYTSILITSSKLFPYPFPIILPLQSPDIELHSKGQCANPTILGRVGVTQMKTSTVTAEVEQVEHGFIPIPPASTLPLHSSVSSGTLPSVPHQYVTTAETMPLPITKQPPQLHHAFQLYSSVVFSTATCHCYTPKVR